MDENSDSLYRGQGKVSKKRRGKKNKNTINPINVNPEESISDLTQSIVDSASGSNITEASDDNEDTENFGLDFGVRFVEISEGNSGITTDGMMKTPPKITISDEKLNESHLKEEEIEEKQEIPILINTKALTKTAATYELEKFEKNALLIINQENIEGYSKPRLGTEKDVEALTNTFGNLGFEVTEHKDLTKEDLFKELRTFSEMDFTNYGCIAIAVLTHGTTNGLLRAKDKDYSEVEILNFFKAHDKLTLVTKPRLLIIQACRGGRGIQGVAVLKAGNIRKDLDDEVEPYYLPVESDMLVLHSSYAGNPSHRDEIHGSWFIQSLCGKLRELAPGHDFESILVEVKREVAIDRYHEQYNRRTYEMDTNKQMPVLTSTLIRKLYFKRFGEGASALHVPTTSTDRGSYNEVLDNVPNTPLQIQFGPCSCFLEHFTYITNCLRYFLDENPHDTTGQAFLDLADTFEDKVEFHASKQRLLQHICNHLMMHSKDYQFYRFLYFYKH